MADVQYTKKAVGKNDRKNEVSLRLLVSDILVPLAAYISIVTIIHLLGIDFIYVVMNIMLTIAIFGFSLMIFRNSSVSLIISAVLHYSVYYINQCVYSARSTVVQYNDIYCIGDALRVAGRYQLPINAEIILKFIICVLIITVSHFVSKKIRSKEKSDHGNIKKLYSVSGFGYCVLNFIFAFSVMTNNSPLIPNFYINIFTEEHGLYYSLITEYKLSKPSAPKNYSNELAVQTLEKYSENDSLSVAGDSEDTDIIVIMNESLTDYSLIGDIGLKSDCLENIHNLDKNCVKGNLAVSIFGGNTCNTEFEFLTGNSMAFLPNFSLPYLQYIHNNIDSVSWDLNSSGRNTIAIHPYFSEEWRRNTVYKFLGFDKFISGEDFGNPDYKDLDKHHIYMDNRISFGDDIEYYRGFISDRECYNKILESLTDEPDFIFAVTIQNHGSYSGEYGTDKYSYLNDDLNEFISSIEESDIAFEELIQELQDRPQKTIVLMFGDHQPGIGSDPFGENFVSNNDVIGELERKYIVPYVMWTNYDSDLQVPEYISPNYLSAVLKSNVGLPLTNWDRLRLEAMKQYPVITCNFAVDSSGQLVSLSETENSDVMNDYRMVQYRNIFE